MSSVEINEIDHVSCGKCICISNKIIKLIITIDSGPRIISFSYMNQKNILLCEQDNNNYDPLKCGHRLWFNQQTIPDPYFLDNNKVIYTPLQNGVKFSNSLSEKLGIELNLEILLSPDALDVMIVHEATNVSKEDMTLALIASTSVNEKGILIAPITQEDDQTYPTRSFALWSYANINDPRFSYSNKYITLKHDNKNENQFKFGINDRDGYVSYLLDDMLFTKRYVHNKDARYLDFGTSLQVYMDKNYTIIDTISPLYNVKPNDTIKHVENWSIFKPKCQLTNTNDEQIDKLINSLT